MDVDKLDQLLKAATKGPWGLGDRGTKKDGSQYARVFGRDWIGLARVWVRMHSASEDTPSGVANAELIALAPDLAAEVIRLTAERDADVAANQALVTENARLIGFIEEVRDVSPDRYSWRANDPQDDVPDMIDASWLDALQEDAMALVGRKMKKAIK